MRKVIKKERRWVFFYFYYLGVVWDESFMYGFEWEKEVRNFFFDFDFFILVVVFFLRVGFYVLFICLLLEILFFVWFVCVKYVVSVYFELGLNFLWDL